MQVRLLAFGIHLRARLRGDPVRHQPQASAGAVGEHLQHARAFEIVEIVERIRYARSAHDHAVIGEKQHVGVAQLRSDAVAFGRADRQAVVSAVIFDAAVKAQRVLARPCEFAVLDDRQRRRIRHMGVEHALCARVRPMDAAMNEESSRFDRVLARDVVAVTVDDDQVGRRDFRPVQSLRIYQEAARPARNCEAEMIAYALRQSQPLRRAQGRDEVAARFTFNACGDGFFHAGSAVGKCASSPVAASPGIARCSMNNRLISSVMSGPFKLSATSTGGWPGSRLRATRR